MLALFWLVSAVVSVSVAVSVAVAGAGSEEHPLPPLYRMIIN